MIKRTVLSYRRPRIQNRELSRNTSAERQEDKTETEENKKRKLILNLIEVLQMIYPHLITAFESFGVMRCG
jgi:hypothetical protein